MQSCADCYWYWVTSFGSICHHEMSLEDDMETDGVDCPFFDPKDNVEEDLPDGVWD